MKKDPVEVFLDELCPSDTNPQDLCGEYDGLFVAIYLQGRGFVFYIEDDEVEIRSKKTYPDHSSAAAALLRFLE